MRASTSTTTRCCGSTRCRRSNRAGGAMILGRRPSPTICVVTPAVMNAILAATGKPVRDLPLKHVEAGIAAAGLRLELSGAPQPGRPLLLGGAERCRSDAGNWGITGLVVRSAGRPARSRGCKSLYDEGRSEPHRPRVMRSGPRGPRRSVDRGAHRPAIEPRRSLILGADAVHKVEGNMSGRDSARPGRPGVVRDPGMLQTLLAREPGDLAIGRSAKAAGPHRKARSRSR